MQVKLCPQGLQVGAELIRHDQVSKIARGYLEQISVAAMAKEAGVPRRNIPDVIEYLTRSEKRTERRETETDRNVSLSLYRHIADVERGEMDPPMVLAGHRGCHGKPERWGLRYWQQTIPLGEDDLSEEDLDAISTLAARAGAYMRMRRWDAERAAA